MRSAFSVLLAALVAVATTVPSYSDVKKKSLEYKGSSAATIAEARLLPPDEKILFIMGQDSETLADYKQQVLNKDDEMPWPGGVTLYTGIAEGKPELLLGGLHKPYDYGAGEVDFKGTLASFPDAALIVGLALTDNAKTKNGEPTRAIGAIHGDDINKDKIARYHSYVDKLINYLKDLQRPVYLRIGYEFDGPWNKYKPEPYKKAFRHMKQRIDALGADNVATVWHSAAFPRDQEIYVGSDPTTIEKFYPGDDVVDWIGMTKFSGEHYKKYQWSCTHLNPEWFEESITPLEIQTRMLNFARKHKKPVMIAEAAPQGFDLNKLTASCIFNRKETKVSSREIWDGWFEPLFDFVESNKDVIRAVAYINTYWDSQQRWHCSSKAKIGRDKCPEGYWGDSRVQTNAEILTKFKAEIAKPIYVNGKQAKK